MAERPTEHEPDDTDAHAAHDASPAQDGGAADEADKREDERKAAEAEAARKRRRPIVFAIGAVIVLALIFGGAYYWLANRGFEDTDDAFTDGRAVAIAPQVSGVVVSLDVTDNQFVKKGQPLIHIDNRQYINDRDQQVGALDTMKAQLEGQKLGAEVARKNFPASLQQAQAQLSQSRANLIKAQADYDRQRSLPKAATTQQEVDATLATLRSAEAQVLNADAQVQQRSPVRQQIGQVDTQIGQINGQLEQAQARLNQSELNLSWTVVVAPQDGWVTRRNVEVGNYAQPGQQIFSIVSPEVWVTANFKESQLDLMRPGQSVRIRVDAYPNLDLRGHVDSIQLGSGSKFTAFPPENATGNFVKIVQRVPVKIVIDSGLDRNVPLPLGISAVPRVTVR